MELWRVTEFGVIAQTQYSYLSSGRHRSVQLDGQMGDCQTQMQDCKALKFAKSYREVKSVSYPSSGTSTSTKVTLSKMSIATGIRVSPASSSDSTLSGGCRKSLILATQFTPKAMPRTSRRLVAIAAKGSSGKGPCDCCDSYVLSGR